MITIHSSIAPLASTPANHTCTNLAGHLEGVSHNAAIDYIMCAKTYGTSLLRSVEPMLNGTECLYPILDDIV